MKARDASRRELQEFHRLQRAEAKRKLRLLNGLVKRTKDEIRAHDLALGRLNDSVTVTQKKI